MPITAEQLETILTGLHTEAKKIFRRDGRLTPALLLISDEGTSRLISMPDGLIDENRMTEHARAVKPAAILYSGESWLGSTTLPSEKAARLPLDDTPAPSEQPDRREAIITRAIARTADGEFIRADRAHLIVRKETGVQLKPLDAFPDEGRTDGLSAFLGALIPSLDNESNHAR
jgi:hypothetical protein